MKKKVERIDREKRARAKAMREGEVARLDHPREPWWQWCPYDEGPLKQAWLKGWWG